MKHLNWEFLKQTFLSFHVQFDLNIGLTQRIVHDGGTDNSELLLWVYLLSHFSYRNFGKHRQFSLLQIEEKRNF